MVLFSIQHSTRRNFWTEPPLEVFPQDPLGQWQLWPNGTLERSHLTPRRAFDSGIANKAVRYLDNMGEIEIYDQDMELHHIWDFNGFPSVIPWI